MGHWISRGAMDREDAYMGPAGGQCGKGWVGIKGACRRGKAGKDGTGAAVNKAGGRRMTDQEKAKSMKMAQANRAARPTKPTEPPIMETRKMNGGSSALARSGGGQMATVKQRAIDDTRTTVKAVGQVAGKVRDFLNSPEADNIRGAIGKAAMAGLKAGAGAAGKTAGKGFAVAMSEAKKAKKRGKR